MKPWLNVSEAAEYAGLSRDTIYTACEQGELRSVRVSGRRTIRIRPAWIDAWLERYASDVHGSPSHRRHAERSGVMNPRATRSDTTRALTEREVGELLGLSVATLRAWRHRGKGPRFLRLGRSVRYLPSDVADFVRASAVDTTPISSSDDDAEVGELPL